MSVDLGKNKLLYLGTAKGLFIFQKTDTWQKVAHPLEGEDISILGWDERAQHKLLCGTANGNLFFSADFGLSWQQVLQFPEQKIWSITPDPHQAVGSFYLGLDGGHLYHLENYGEDCYEMSGIRQLPHAAEWFGPFGAAIFHSVIPVAQQPGLVYASLSVVGVLCSKDGGNTWEDTTANLPRVPPSREGGAELADIHKIALHPLQPERLYATSHMGTFRSDDGARSWQDISDGLPFPMTRPLALHPQDPHTVFVIAHEDVPDSELPVIREQLLVHRSRDGGRTWQGMDKGLPNPANCAVLREAFITDNANPYQLYLGTNKGQVYLSADEGENWELIANVGASVRVVRVYCPN